jgi:hypothetical protein
MVVGWGEVNGDTDENRIYYQQYTAAGAPAGERVEVLHRGDTAAWYQGSTFVVAVDDPGDNALLVYLSDDARPNTLPGPDEDFTGQGHGVVRHLGADAGAPFGANQAPVAGRIADVTAQGVASSAIPLFPVFSDDRDADASLKFAVSGNTNEALISGTAIDPATGVLTLTYAPGQVGQAIVVVTATDTGGLSTKLYFNVKVQAGPTVVPNPNPTPTPNPTPEPQPQPAPVVGEPPALSPGTGIVVGRLMQKTAGAKRRKAPAAGVAVFLDADADGVKDQNEPTATTGADGSYAFTGLVAGRYQVRVGDEGWQVVTRKARKPRAVHIRTLQRRPARVKPILLVQAPTV